jgi:hypothetical protein
MGSSDPVSADTPFVEVDLKDSAYRRVAKFANRMEKLLAARPTDPHLRDTLDLLLGVLYALTLPKMEGFVVRTKTSRRCRARESSRHGVLAAERHTATGKWRERRGCGRLDGERTTAGRVAASSHLNRIMQSSDRRTTLGEVPLR